MKSFSPTLDLQGCNNIPDMDFMVLGRDTLVSIIVRAAVDSSTAAFPLPFSCEVVAIFIKEEPAGDDGTSKGASVSTDKKASAWKTFMSRSIVREFEIRISEILTRF